MVRLRLLGWCAAALCVAAVAGAQDLGRSVTFKSNAMTADALLAALGKEIGLSLTASDDVRKDVLAVRLSAVPASEALQRIAGAVSGQWTRAGGGYQLIRDDDLVRQARQADIAAKALLWKPLLAPEQSESAPPLGGDSALRELVRYLDPAAIAGLGRGERLVFSPSATRMQRRLPAKAVRILSDIVSAMPAPSVPGGAPNAGGPRAAYVVVTTAPNAQWFYVGLQLVTPFGLTYGPVVTMASPKEEAKAAPDVGPKEGEKPVALSDAAKQAVAWFQTPALAPEPRFTAGAGTPVLLSSASPAPSGPAPLLDEQTRQRIVNPEKYEPLGTIPSEALMAAAEASNSNMVACLPDSAMAASAACFASGPKTPSQVLAYAKEVWGLSVELKGGWLIAKPANLVASLDNRVDRQALGRALRAMATQGTLSLDEQANYALNSPQVMQQFGIDAEYFRLLDPSVGVRTLSQLYSVQRDVLRFWGALTAGQRRSLLAGERLSFGRLAGNARSAVNSLIYNSSDGPTGIVPSGPGGPGGPAPVAPGMGGVRAFERTEAFPDGLPRAGIVTLRATREPAVLAFVSPTTAGQAFSARQFGMLRAQAEGGVNMGRSTASYTSFVPGAMSTFTFQFFLTPNVGMVRTIQGMEVARGAVASDYSGLPAEFRTAVDAAYRQYFERARGFDGGGRVLSRPGRAIP